MTGKPRDLRGIFTGSDASRAIRDRAQRLREAIDADERLALRELAARHAPPAPIPLVVEELKDETRELLRRAAVALRRGHLEDRPEDRDADLELADDLVDAADAQPLPPLRHLEDPLDRSRASILESLAPLADAVAADDAHLDLVARIHALADEIRAASAADAAPGEELPAIVLLPREAALVILEHLARLPGGHRTPGPKDDRARAEWSELSCARLLSAEAIANARILDALYPEQEARP